MTDMQNYLNQLLFWGVVLVLSQDRLGGVYSNLFIVPKEEYSHYSVHKIPQQIPSYSKIIHGVHKVSSCLSKSKGTDCICEHRRCLSACSQFTHLYQRFIRFAVTNDYYHFVTLPFGSTLFSQGVHKCLGTLACPHYNSGHF